jgi:hypothetical protein
MASFVTLDRRLAEGRSMVNGLLPDEGPVRLGPVALPAGRPVHGYGGRYQAAWATVDTVPGSGRIWAALSELHPQTGLVPIQLDSLAADGTRPWDGGDLIEPADPGAADGVDAGALLENLWRGSVWPDEDDAEAMERWAPFTLDWPGLAAPEPAPLTPAERQHALDAMLPRIRVARGETPEARIGLVAAGRPADVLPVLGWGGLVNHAGLPLLWLTAVLRSWEDRFGAHLIDVGHDTLGLLVDRPPRTLAAAQRVAAEQVVLGGDCIDGARDVAEIAARLMNAPIWTFWWD